MLYVAEAEVEVEETNDVRGSQQVFIVTPCGIGKWWRLGRKCPKFLLNGRGEPEKGLVAK